MSNDGVLDSRIQNLHLLPDQRTDAGIAQARLAVDIASDIAALRVFLLYGIDPLKGVPLEDFRTTSALHKVRWPQIVSEVSEIRQEESTAD